MFRKSIRTLALAAATVGLTAAAAAPAQAYNTAELMVFPTAEPSVCMVRVVADFPMSKSQAQARINAGDKAIVRVWGEDSYYDDLLSGPHKIGKPGVNSRGSLFASENGLILSMMWNVAASTLNEDNTPGNPYDEFDELYAGVRWVDAQGRQKKAIESNRIEYRYFGATGKIGGSSKPCGR